MGNLEQVQVPAEETGALSPEQEAAQLTQTQETTDEVPQETEEVDVERPEYLPEKFKNTEELAAAYQALEAKQSAGATEAPTELSAEGLAHYSERFAENGKLEDSEYAEIEALGLPRGMVDTYIQGQQDSLALAAQTVYTEVGGEAEYNEMVAWGKTNLSPGEVTLYDEAVNSGDMNKVMNAVRGLNARRGQIEGTSPNIKLGSSKGNSTSGYGSLEEMKTDMRNPKYHNDPAFRKMVTQRLSVSKIM
jgi:hypothetical protein